MPEYLTEYRGRKVTVELDKEGNVEDIVPADRGDSFIVTEHDKIDFELDRKSEIQDAMEEYVREMAEYKRARGRERIGGE